MSDTGIIQWVKSFGGLASDQAASIQFAFDGGLLITGFFQGLVDFDPNVGTYILNTSMGVRDIFIQKLDANGNFLWAKQIGGSYSSNITATCSDINNSILITGNSKGTVDFDPDSSVFNLTGYYSYLFVLKLDSAGSFLWAKNIKSGGTKSGLTMTTDHRGNVIIGGTYNLGMDFDPGMGNTTLNPNGIFDAFLWKLDKNGAFAWAKSFGGAAYDRVWSLVIDDMNNIYSTGYFSQTVDFSSGLGSNIEVSNNGSRDFFIQKTDSLGNLLWVETGGGNGYDLSNHLIFDKTRNIVHVGIFSGTVDFDPGNGFDNLSPSHGGAAGFIRKLNQCTEQTVSTHSACLTYTWIDGKTYTQSNNSAKFYMNSAIGCDSIITLNLDIKTVNTGITKNGLTLTANATGASYQWIDCDANTFISGETDSFYEVNRSGSYAVVVQENGCLDTSNCFIYLNVSVNNISITNELSLYPNPVKNTLHIGLEDLTISNETELIIYDSHGKELLIKHIKEDTIDSDITLDFSSFAPGIYFLTIKTEDYWYSNSFIKH